MKCEECEKIKKASNCQKCFLNLKNDYWIFLNTLEDEIETIHLSTLTKIKKSVKNKREQIRNFHGDI